MAVNVTSQPGNNAIKPDKPTSVSASATAGGNATVSFAASINPGKGNANYVATSSPNGITGTSSSSPISITGLTNGQAYTFTVVKQSGSGVTSDTSDASGSITAYSAPTFGTQSGSSTATAPSTTSTTSVSSVSTTTATLGRSLGSGASFYDYERLSGTAVTPSGNSLSGLAQKTAHSWRVRVTNSSSTFALTTRVTPNGSATTVSVEYGTSTSYGTSAGSVNIGSGLSEVASSWDLGSSGSATIYYRITATYAGGATVQNTGSISRAVSVYNGSSVSFETYGTYTYTNIGASLAIPKDATGVNISSISFTLVGGGGGGTSNSGYGAGGGGGGQLVTVSGLSSSASISITRGAGGAANGYGDPTSLTYSGGTYYANGGTPAVGAQGGASPLGGGSYNYGYVGNISFGGGGGGAGGASTGGDGGPASSGVGPGGPGFYNLAPYGGTGTGLWGSGGSSTSAGAGGAGGSSSGTSGQNGYFSITYVGPHRVGGSLSDG